MSGVCLDDHGAAGREGRGGVGAGDAEREGEVARREDEHDADRFRGAPQVRTRSGDRVRVGEIDDHTPGVSDRFAVELELGRRPRHFTPEAGLGQIGLLTGECDEGLRLREERSPARAHDLSPGLGIDRAEAGAGGGRCGQDRLEFVVRRGGDRGCRHRSSPLTREPGPVPRGWRSLTGVSRSGP